MKQLLRNYTPLQLITHLGAWVPLVWTLVDFFTDNLTINPIQAATQRTGKYALVLLVLSLACTPLNTFFGFRQALKLRRPLGLYAFMYACIHLSIFFVLDYGLDFSIINEIVLEKPYATVGLATFLLLLPLALTSSKWSMKKLGKNWKRLHRLVYVAGVTVIVHYFWASKGDFLRLSGDIVQPMIFGAIVALLLIARIPPVRRRLSNLRSKAGSLLPWRSPQTKAS